MKKTLNTLSKEANFLSLAGNITIAFFGFVGFALIARSYSLEILGQWVLYISASAFVEMFRFGITNTAIVRFLSGVDHDERIKFIGSNVLIGLVSTSILAFGIWLCHIYFPIPIKNAGYELFFTWYPLNAFINLPFNNALVILQADQKFKKMFFIKAFESGIFFLVVMANHYYLHLAIVNLVIYQLIINGFSSLICMIKGWDGIFYIKNATKRTNKILLDFGKYTTFTLIGSNLLRSADTLIISLSPLGTAAVALYSIPLKLTEIQQIPLRSFIATAFPKMSKASVRGKIEEVKDLFYTYSGVMTILFFFISIFTFTFADFLVLLLGGSKFQGIHPIIGADPVTIMRVFSIYGLLLPLDRMTGVCLDSINRPNKNLGKVSTMVVANVIGDIIAVFVFKSLVLVAVGSILFTILGVWIGWYFLDKELHLNPNKLISAGIVFYKEMYRKIRSRKMLFRL